MLNIVKNCRKTFEKKCDENKSQINELLTNSEKQFLKLKMVHDSTHVENNMEPKVEVACRSKDKEKRTSFRCSFLIIVFISA